ncbi:hypothetical protein K435DRAFT_854983 [Dendrothele bispora CBS 962.96]|uniref:Uncharacterized protein n=1 Tax=Dendrothele bispora (strain CBS 962.96) TaxID=1314807 RepID=A0A4S8MCS2_DENBC|nr:hypothetical protein K435DRAFT_854983 [Dendrothele bispora CBS 962.96]
MSNFFQNTSHSSFEGSHIINTAGDHTTNVAEHNIYIAAVDNITQIIGSQDQIVSNGVRGGSIFNEVGVSVIRLSSTGSDFTDSTAIFVVVIYGFYKNYLQEIDEQKTPLWWDQDPTQKRLKYTRTAHSVSLFGVADNYIHCVAMHYSGRDAYDAWERDFLSHSNQYDSHTISIVFVLINDLDFE